MGKGGTKQLPQLRLSAFFRPRKLTPNLNLEIGRLAFRTSIFEKHHELTGEIRGTVLCRPQHHVPKTRVYGQTANRFAALG